MNHHSCGDISHEISHGPVIPKLMPKLRHGAVGHAVWTCIHCQRGHTAIGEAHCLVLRTRHPKAGPKVGYYGKSPCFMGKSMDNLWIIYENLWIIMDNLWIWLYSLNQ